MEDTTKLIQAAVENYFETDNLKYEPFNENNVARTSFGIKTKFGHVDILFIAYDTGLVVTTIIPLKAEDKEDRIKVGEFLLRVNDGLKTGCFDFDLNTGRISYRVSIFCGKENFALPTYEQIDYAVLISLSTVQKFGNALMKVVFGFANPLNALEEVE